MKLNFIQQCGLGHTRLSLRLLVILLSHFCISSISRSQLADSLIHIKTIVSGEYADILRQRSDHSSTTIFARSFDATISASRGCDTLTLAYSGWNQYASYNQFPSSIATSADNSLRSLSLQWISSVGWLDYSATVLFPFSHTFLPLHYGAWIRLKPFGKAIMPMLTYERLPTLFTSGLGLKDFSFSLDEHSMSSAWNVTLQSQPIEFMEGSFSWGKNITTTMGEADGYSSPLDWNMQIFSAQLKIDLREKSSFWIGWEERDGMGKAPLIKDGLKFGSLSYGEGNFYHWKIGVKTIIFSLPMACEYQYRRWEGEAHGHIESWPFLSFMESVFTNRLTYELYGNFDIHQIECQSSMKWGNWQIEPMLGIFYVLPNISLLYREYDLPPIVKKITEEQLSIQQCWLLKLGCKVEFPVYEVRVALEVEQFIPFFVKDRERRASVVEPNTPASPSNASALQASTDGGRRIRLQMFLP